MPVVGVTAAFTLTPLFAHNQSAVLNQLLSPSSSIAYDSPNIDFNHVQVRFSHTKLLCCICNVYKPVGLRLGLYVMLGR